MRLISRFVSGVLIVVLVLVIVGGAWVFFDSQMGVSAADVSNVRYPSADGVGLVGYLARPPQGEGPFPAVLMVHEWWGLNAEITELADMLAEEGYVVLAPDTYRGRVAQTVPGALYLRLRVSPQVADADMQAAFNYLASLPEVDANRIGVMGFCYGGGVALRHATQNDRIRATVNLYGDVVREPEGFGVLLDTLTPVLGIFGAEDQQIPLSTVEAFEEALLSTDIPHSVIVYPGVGHAFVNPASIAEGGAARTAWGQILAFFAEHLGAQPATG